MRLTVIDKNGTVSFVAPWNTLKALVAAVSQKPGPGDFQSLIEAATKYDTGLGPYIKEGLAAFEEAYKASESGDQVLLSPRLEKELKMLLKALGSEDEFETGAGGVTSPDNQEEEGPSGKDLAHLPVFRVVDEVTRQQSLEPVQIGLVIFNLLAKRIIQVQNSLGTLKRSDRGRYFEGGQPTDRLYFYRLPSDWTMVP